MVKTLTFMAALALAAPALAQAAPAQSWPVMNDHTLDMPSQGAHSRSRPWLKAAATPVKKAARTKRMS